MTSVSALDRYIHDLVLLHSLRLLRKPEDSIPRNLRELKIPLLAVKKAIEKIKGDHTARPGSIIKQEIQDILHQNHTFQSPPNLDYASGLLGISNFWSKVGSKMPNKPEGKNVKKRLSEITKRRNEIVHEADLILKAKGKKLTLRDIDRNYAQSAKDWMQSFVEAIHIICKTI